MRFARMCAALLVALMCTTLVSAEDGAPLHRRHVKLPLQAMDDAGLKKLHDALVKDAALSGVKVSKDALEFDVVEGKSIDLEVLVATMKEACGEKCATCIPIERIALDARTTLSVQGVEKDQLAAICAALAKLENVKRATPLADGRIDFEVADGHTVDVKALDAAMAAAEKGAKTPPVVSDIRWTGPAKTLKKVPGSGGAPHR